MKSTLKKELNAETFDTLINKLCAIRQININDTARCQCTIISDESYGFDIGKIMINANEIKIDLEYYRNQPVKDIIDNNGNKRKKSTEDNEICLIDNISGEKQPEDDAHTEDNADTTRETTKEDEIHLIDNISGEKPQEDDIDTKKKTTEDNEKHSIKNNSSKKPTEDDDQSPIKKQKNNSSKKSTGDDEQSPIKKRTKMVNVTEI